MSLADEQRISQELSWDVVYNCPGGSSRVRRPRTFWINHGLAACSEVVQDTTLSRTTLTFLGQPEPSAMWVSEGWRWVTEDRSSLRLPTFTRAIPRTRPAFKAPGLNRVDASAFQRYARDGFRYPPYTYAREYCLARTDQQGAVIEESLRVAIAQEREVLMGFVPGFTRPILGRASRKRPDSWSDDCCRAASVGNSFHTLSTSVLVGLMLQEAGYAEVVAAPSLLQDRFFAELFALRRSGPEAAFQQALAGEFIVENPRLVLGETSAALRWAEHEEAIMLDSEFGERAALDGGVAAKVAADGICAEQQIVEHYVRRSQARGGEVRIDLGQVYESKPCHRRGIDGRHWKWRHVIGQKVCKQQHINALELRAIGLSVKWRLRARQRQGRCLHLTDSQVCLSVLAKGRTNSARLRPHLRQIAARVVTGGLMLTVGYITSEQNPSDEPSRAP